MLIYVICSVVLFYCYLTWNYSYWKKKGVPGPDAKLIHGNTPSFLFWKRHIIYDIHEIYRKWRKNSLVGFYVLRSPTLLAIDKDVIKQVLIKNFKSFRNNEVSYQMDKKSDPLFGRNPFILQDEEWKEKRNQIAPAMTIARLKSLSPLIEDVCKKLIHFITRNVDKNECTFEARQLTGRFTTSVIASTLYGVEANAFEKDICEIHQKAIRLIEVAYRFLEHSIGSSFIPLLGKFWRISTTRKDVIDFFMQITEEAIKIREQNGSNQSDFLEQMIQTKNKKNLTGYDLVSHGVVIFWDGYETTHIAITLTLYELAKNKHVQQKLREHILNAGEFNYDSIIDLPYLEQCIFEALRINPPLASFTRVCTDTTEVIDSKDKKFIIEKDTSVVIPVFSIHNDPEYFPEPQKFYPERFDPENGGIKKYRDECLLMPFGEGPRICLGMRLGLLQVKYFVSAVLRNFEISLDEKTVEPFELLPKHLLTVPKNNIYLKFKKL